MTVTGETCKFCEKSDPPRRTIGDYRVRDALVTCYPCVDHLQDAIQVALVMTPQVTVEKWNRA